MTNFEPVIKKYVSKYKNADLTRQDVSAALRRYRDLRPSLEPFVFNDGRSQHLLQLEGTIPVPYKGNTYNIPVQLWVLDSHPYNPPMVYVRPTSTMQIKSGRYVDCNGKVDMPFLREWRWPKSDMMGLLDILILTFGEECPVFSKVPARPPPPPPAQPPFNPSAAGQMPGMPQPPPSQQHSQPAPPSYPGYPQQPQPPQPQPSAGSYPPSTMFPPGYPHQPPRGYTPGASGAGYPPGMAGGMPLGPGGHPQVSQAPLSSSPQLPPGGFAGYGGGGGNNQPPPLAPPPYPSVVAHSSAAAGTAFATSVAAAGSSSASVANHDTAVSSMSGVRAATGTVTEEHLRVSMLSAVEDKLKRKLREFFAQAQAEMDVLKKTQTDLLQGKEKLDRVVQDLEEENATLDTNMALITHKDQEVEDALTRMTNQQLDVDEAVVTTAPLYRQLLDAFAEEQAIEDAIYYLGEGLRRNVIELEVFLKQVRELSRRQFMQRALIQKCREKAGLPPLLL